MPRLTALLLALGLFAGCTSEAPDAAPGAAPGATPTVYDASAPLPPTSLYALDDVWTDDGGDALRLADLRGRPVMVAMVYAHCAYACPLIVRDMKALAGQLSDPGDLRFVLVTLDPERDTPEALARLRDGFDLDETWTLLRGDDRSVRRLAALLGVRYREEADGTISHSNLVTLLDRDGRVAARQEGLGAGSTDAVTTLRGLVAAR